MRIANNNNQQTDSSEYRSMHSTSPSPLLFVLTVGPPSMGFPDPLKMRPSMSLDTAVFITSPVNSSLVLRLSMPDVPSKTCTTARSPSTSRTCPRRMVPSASRMSTISAYLAPLTCSRITRGPDTPAMVEYSGGGGGARGGGREGGEEVREAGPGAVLVCWFAGS